MKKIRLKQFSKNELDGFGFSIRTGGAFPTAEFFAGVMFLFPIFIYWLFKAISKYNLESSIFYKALLIYTMVDFGLIVATNFMKNLSRKEKTTAFLFPVSTINLSLFLCNVPLLYFYGENFSRRQEEYRVIYLSINVVMIVMILMGYFYVIYITKNKKIKKAENERMESLKIQSYIKRLTPIALGLALLARFITVSMSGVGMLFLLFCGYTLAFFSTTIYMPFYLKWRFPEDYLINKTSGRKNN